MLFYLDNFYNQAAAPNENYAREWMELHTLGVDGSYTEQDVKEVRAVSRVGSLVDRAPRSWIRTGLEHWHPGAMARIFLCLRRTGNASMAVRLKRVYEPPRPTDGLRILVDRLWPRGVSKQSAAIDRWLREIAPSNGLRKWYGHDPRRWTEFHRRYREELRAQRVLVGELRRLARRQRITLLFAAHDEQHNNAVVLRELLAAARPASSRKPRTHHEQRRTKAG